MRYRYLLFRYSATLLLFMILCVVKLSAQERLVVSNALVNGQNCVWLKWYDEKVFYPEGVNIYRISQSNNQQVKLNTKPIKKFDYQIPLAAMQADTTLEKYVEMAKKVKPQDVKGFMSLFLIVKTLESNEFSKYVGIMYEDCTTTFGETYNYEVYEIIAGKEKLIEKSAALRVIGFTPANAPEDLVVVADDGSVFLHWKHEEKRFWGVNIYRKTTNESSFTLINSRPIMLSEVPKEDGTKGYPEIFYTDKELQNGVAYTYKIEGIDYFTRSTAYSKEITVTPKDKTPPIAPHNLQAEVGLLDITLTWQNNFKSSDMAGYNVYRKKGSEGTNILLNKTLLPSEQGSYYDTVTAPGTYIYYVASVDSSGNEGLSYATAGQVLDVFPPKTPVGLKVVADTGRIVLTWNANTEDDLAGYRIYRTVGSNMDDNYVLLNAKAIQATEYIDSLPENAKNFFFYKITAVDSAYNMSEYTTPRSSRMPDIIPPREPFIIGVAQDEKSLQVQWLANSETDLLGYNIYRFQTSDSANTNQKLNISILRATAQIFTDNWADGNIDYRYYLTAIDSSGNISEPSTCYDARLIVEEPCSIEIKKIKAYAKKNGKISVSWKISIEDEEAYQGCILYRKSLETNAYKALNSLSKTTKYSDKFGKEDISFEYQVRAYDKNGCIVKSKEVFVKKKEKK